jgi:hypothetical protein
MIDDIKREFPWPRSYIKSQGLEGYCVGGAVCIFTGQGTNPYPRSSVISAALAKLNSHLADWPGVAHTFGWLITNYSDDEKFDEAWRVAGEALVWQPKAE